MTANGDYSQNTRTFESTVYTGRNPKHVCRAIKERLRKAGIMNKDCEVKPYENGEAGTVGVKVKEHYRSEVLRLVREAIMRKIHPKSKKGRPTKLLTEARSSLFLYRG